MTKVIEQKDGDTIEFTIDGHADKINPDEGNILCAAVSMLGQTLMECLWKIKADARMESRAGYIRILCRMEENEVEIKHLFDFAKTGFLLLKSRYPEQFDLVGEF